MISISLSSFCAPKSGAKTGGVGFWNDAEVVKTSAALFSNAGSAWQQTDCISNTPRGVGQGEATDLITPPLWASFVQVFLEERPLSPQELKLIGDLAKLILGDREQVEFDAPVLVIAPAILAHLHPQYRTNNIHPILIDDGLGSRR